MAPARDPPSCHFEEPWPRWSLVPPPTHQEGAGAGPAPGREKRARAWFPDTWPWRARQPWGTKSGGLGERGRAEEGAGWPDLLVGLIEEDTVDGIRLLEVHRPLAQLQVVVLLAHGGRRGGGGGSGGGSQRGTRRAAPCAGSRTGGGCSGSGGGDPAGAEAASWCHAPTPSVTWPAALCA